MGMMLSEASLVKVFRDNFISAQESLRKALVHADDSVRMRAAFVIGEIGGTARPLGDDLLNCLIEESDQLVRIYIVDVATTCPVSKAVQAKPSIRVFGVLFGRYTVLDD